MPRRFTQVDVFGSTELGGNPLAVVLDGDGLSDAEMQRFARWTNLSETTFVLAPTRSGADYRVRIFTPDREMPFAGHPTIGTCHAWLATQPAPPAGGQVVQECGAGLVALRQTGDGLAFAAPPLIRSGPLDEALLDEIASALEIERSQIVAGEWVDNGPGWAAVLLPDADAVLALAPRHVDLDLGVIGPHPAGGPADYEVRAFFPVQGSTVEDPVTGSLNAGLAQWLLGTGRATAPYTVRQGTALGCDGRVGIATDEHGAVWVSGSARTYVTGEVDL